MGSVIRVSVRLSVLRRPAVWTEQEQQVCSCIPQLWEMLRKRRLDLAAGMEGDIWGFLSET